MAEDTPDLAPNASEGLPDAYFAGYFDGEGHVGFHHRTAGTLPRIRITVKSTNLPSLRALQARFGGKVLLHSAPTARRKSQFRWRIGSLYDCHAFVQAVEPFSIEKREQLSLARQWLDHRMEIPLRGRRFPETYSMADRIREAISVQKRLDFYTLVEEAAH